MHSLHFPGIWLKQNLHVFQRTLCGYSKIVFQDTDNMQKCINILYRVLRIRPKLMKNTMLNVDILHTVLDHFEGHIITN